MSLFDDLVSEALKSDGALGTVRPAVEKELLHHDILREMSRAGLLDRLTFMGGTCLRLCHGSPRLSEDLDFTGGEEFAADQLAELAQTLESTLMEKYSLPVQVSEPIREQGNVCTWKLRVETQQDHKHLPNQRIHIDICSLPSHRRTPSLLRNHYDVDMGTDGLIVQIESRQEILADKWVALAMRANRIQYRDLWDIVFLQQRGVDVEEPLVVQKLKDRKIDRTHFAELLDQRIGELADPKHHAGFANEMKRFLPTASVGSVAEPAYWSLLNERLAETRKRLVF